MTEQEFSVEEEFDNKMSKLCDAGFSVTHAILMIGRREPSLFERYTEITGHSPRDVLDRYNSLMVA